MKTSILIISLLTALFFTIGCSTRTDTPKIYADSTIVFPAKKPDDISSKITFYRKMNIKKGELAGKETVFTIAEKEKVRAFIEIENRDFYKERELMFHIDWIDSYGKSIYQKQILLTPSDTSSILKSSISISPETRQAGKYKLRLYFFRELIAEKNFVLLPEFQIINENGERIIADISFCRKVSKKTGKRIGVDTVFFQKEKQKIRAVVDFENRFAYKNRELQFRFDWIDSMGHTFYKKQIDLQAKDSLASISSSISISSEKRQIGKYSLQLFLFNKLIAQKNFQLKTKPEPVPVKKKNIKASITLCSKIDKKTGNRIGVNTIFEIKEKQRVRAFLDLENLSEYKNEMLIFYFNWIGTDGKSFYKKKIEHIPQTSKSTISSSISISPKKRMPGNYILRTLLFDEIICEKKFELK
ncbi:MAG: hypothetical protein HN704_15045 [Bacteroidetes bacterium]|jgi:hypothetical protein|nr:hypothetical protein [Bacteroidota bacterium]MBT6685820.1 hypothetical protein [Bacteroidota bacterium]MBT7143530.1 hypothetical protein [Bacteroidota bacterium]MBT7492914.1 hypothetical protein [Bacteroidota bacterium]